MSFSPKNLVELMDLFSTKDVEEKAKLVLQAPDLTDARRRLNAFVDVTHTELSLPRQCEPLQVNRSTLYYKAAETNADDIDLLDDTREIW